MKQKKLGLRITMEIAGRGSERRCRMWIIAILLLGLTLCAQTPSPGDISQKLRKLDIETATIQDLVRLFGEPAGYLWGRETFRKENLPARYIARFDPDIHAVVVNGQVVELRLHTAGIKLLDAIEFGSSLDEVFAALGRPKAVVEGELGAIPGVLYRDFQGMKGIAYYSSREKGVRLFLHEGRVSELMLVRKSRFPPDRPVASKIQSGIVPFDDVRIAPGGNSKDASNADFSGKPDLLASLRFNQKTVWPEAKRMPASPTPDALLKAAMNPGLGVRELHARGITGKGVAVGIVDQPLFAEHPEYAGKIFAYHDVGTGQQTSMHGPAVASLLVGKNIGTAPEARLYFVAAPSWNRDSADQARALEWLLEQNRKLPNQEKIRVVSVSGAPSGQGSPFTANHERWDKAVEAAEREGVLVLDCTSHHGIIGTCWFDGTDRERPSRCVPGSPGLGQPRPDARRVLAPTSSRTTAEVYEKGDYGYQYMGRGGVSWAIPYVAGVLAMGWQVRPEMTAKEMVSLLFQSAYRRDSGILIVDPPAFIRAVEQHRRP
jgi:hypothetical protein